MEDVDFVLVSYRHQWLQQWYVWKKMEIRPRMLMTCHCYLAHRRHLGRKKDPHLLWIFFLHLSCLIASHNIHFAKYCRGRKQITQLVSSFVQNELFKEYKDHYTNFLFVKEILKDRLRETLKKIKTCTSNEDNSNKAILQCDEVLEQLKCTDGHAAQNVLKRRQFVIDYCSSSASSGHLECSTPVLSAAQDFSRGMRDSSPKNVKTPIDKPLTKAKMLSAQSMSFVVITNYLTNDFSKGEIVEKKNNRKMLKN